jgi:hypothetical protein
MHEVTINVLGIAGVIVPSPSTTPTTTTRDQQLSPALLQKFRTAASSSSSVSSPIRAVVAVVHNRKPHGTSGLSEPLRVVVTPSSSAPSSKKSIQQSQRYVAPWSSPCERQGGATAGAGDGHCDRGEIRTRQRRFPSTIRFDAKLRSSATEKIDLMVALVHCGDEQKTASYSKSSPSPLEASSVAAVPVGVCSLGIAAAEWRQTNKLILDIPFQYLAPGISNGKSQSSHGHPQCRDFPEIRVLKSDLPRATRQGDEPVETTTSTTTKLAPPSSSPPSSPTRSGRRNNNSGGFTLKRMFSNTSSSSSNRETNHNKNKVYSSKDRRDDDVEDSKSTTSTSSTSGSENLAASGNATTAHLKKAPVQEGLVRLEIQWKRKEDSHNGLHAVEDRECADYCGPNGGGGGAGARGMGTSLCSSTGKNLGSHRGSAARHMVMRDPDYSSARKVFPAVVAATTKKSINNDNNLFKGKNQGKASTVAAATTCNTPTVKSGTAAVEQEQPYPGIIETAASFGSEFYSISTKGDSQFGGPNYCSVPSGQKRDSPPTTVDPAKIDIGGRQHKQQQQGNKVFFGQSLPPAQEEQLTSTEEARTSAGRGCMESSFCALSDGMPCSGSFSMNDVDDDDDDDVNAKEEGVAKIIKIVGLDPSTIGVVDSKNNKSKNNDNNNSPQSVMSTSYNATGVEMETNSRGFARLYGDASVEQQRSCSAHESSTTVHCASSKSVTSSSPSGNTLPMRLKSPTTFYESTPQSNNLSSHSSAQSKENEPKKSSHAGSSSVPSMNALDKTFWPFNMSSRGLDRSPSPSDDEDAGFEVSLVREFSDTTVQAAPSAERSPGLADVDSREQCLHPQLQQSTLEGLHRPFSSLNLRSVDKPISVRPSGSNTSTKKNSVDESQKPSNVANSKGSATMNSFLSSVGSGLAYPLTSSFTRTSSSNKSNASNVVLADKDQKVAGGILRNRSPPHAALDGNANSSSATKGRTHSSLATSPKTKFLREQSADTPLTEISSPNAPFTSDWQWFMRDILMLQNKNEGSSNKLTTKPQKSVRFHPSVMGRVQASFRAEEFDDESRQYYDDDSDWNTLETKETNKSNSRPLWMCVVNNLVRGSSQESGRYQGRSSNPQQTGTISRYLPRVERSQENSDWITNLDWVGMPGILDTDAPWTNYEDDSTWGTLETKESLARPRDDMSLVPLPEDFLFHETYYGCGMRIAKYYDRVFEDNGQGYRGRRQPVPIILLNDMLDERIQHKQGFDDNSIASSRGHGPVSV